MPIQIKETFLGKCGAGAEWWRNAVIYQIYPRSFADSNGDGIGDLVGISSKLSYLSSLGIDAIWLSPFYRSPQLDGGYDIADYCDVDPLFGTMDDFDRMLRQAHDKGIKVIIDLVPNHTSSAHNWFQSALKTPMGSAERNRYHFRDGKGENGELPPNQWKSIFGGMRGRAFPEKPNGICIYLIAANRILTGITPRSGQNLKISCVFG